MGPSSSSRQLRPQGSSGVGFGCAPARDQFRETWPPAAATPQPSLRQQGTESSLGADQGLSDEYIEELAQRSITKSLVQRSVVSSPGF